MSSPAQELQIDSPVESTSPLFPLGGIIGTWYGLASFYFIMSLAALADASFNFGSPSSDPWALGLKITAMAFAVTWGVIAYFGSQRRPWAIRWGFWFTILSLLPILWAMALLPLFELARQGEWLYVGCVSALMVLMTVLTACAARKSSFVRWSTTAIYGIYLIYVPMVVLLLIAIWRSTFIHHLSQGGIPCILGGFPLLLQVWRRYCETCRALVRTQRAVPISISEV